MTTVRRPLLALLLLAATACGNAAAAPRPAAIVPPPAASVALVQRLDAAAANALPDVTGLSVAAARARLTGLTVKVVGFGAKGGGVSAQWPTPGDPAPADGAVVVWLGEPPAPPKPPKASSTPVAKPVPVPPPGAPVPAAPAPAAEKKPPPAADEQPAPATPAPLVGGPGSGITPGLESVVAPAHGPRANIRTLSPAPAGTALAGRASWYGPGFEGRGTACGTTFDPAALTLASRELRCGTKVTVTGPAGAVEATVTDWGPAEWTNRRFDLSQATFAAVASLGSGVIDVTVEVR